MRRAIGIGVLLLAFLFLAGPARAGDLRIGVRVGETGVALRGGQITALTPSDGSPAGPTLAGDSWGVELAAYRARAGQYTSSWLARAAARALGETGYPALVSREGETWVVATPPQPRAEAAAELAAALAQAGFATRVDLGRYPDAGAPGFRLLTAEGAGLVLLCKLDVTGAEVEGRAYRGSLEIARSPATGLLQAVNAVAGEDYLRGVVPHEMPAGWPLEALKAQAVAARTYAAANRGRHAAAGFDLCAGVHCQVYGGRAVEHERTDRAVAATAGLILTYGGTPINAVFHAHAGGHTDSSQEIWGWSAPYLPGVSTTGEKPLPWRLYVTRAGLEAALESRLRAAAPALAGGSGGIRGLLPALHTAAGRVKELEIQAARGVARLSGNALREALGVGVFRSTLFKPVALLETRFGPPGAPVLTYARWPSAAEATLELISLPLGDSSPVPFGLTPGWAWPAGFFFLGDGFGHGVGMSQWGAREMALAGRSAELILASFYPGAVLTAAR